MKKCYNKQTKALTFHMESNDGMTGLLRLIMNANNLFDYGVCAYSKVEDMLIEYPDKKRIPQSAESVICVVFPTNIDAVFDDPNEVFRLRKVASQMLELTCIALRKAFDEYSFEWFLDDSPVPEVIAGSLCGLGAVGDSGLLLSPHYGSFCFIGNIITDLIVPETGDEATYCVHCKKCIVRCPAGALSESGGFDKEKCVKYAVANASLNPNTFLLRQGAAVKGCNTCREVCPYNSNIGRANNHPFIKAAMNPDSMYTSDGGYKPMGGLGQEKFRKLPDEF